MSNFLFYLAAFAVVIGVLIVVHELGHYAVARACGVKVLRFSVGFGRVLWLRRFGADRTEWVIAAFPLGGYVRMLDEREGEVAPGEAHRAFNRQSVWRRIAIVAAGPLANFLFAIAVYWGLFVHGAEELRPLLGTPPAASAAARAGIENGERVLRVGDVPVDTWPDLRWALIRQAVDDDTVSLEVINPRREITVRRLDVSAARAGGWESEALNDLGLVFFRPHLPAVIGKVTAGGAGAAGGLRAGDTVLSIDEAPVAEWADVVRAVREAADRPLRMRVLHADGTEAVLVVTPERREERGRTFGRIGVAARDGGPAREELMVVVRHDPFTALDKAVRETWDKSVFSLVMFRKMLTGEVSWRNLSGPVTIADYAGQSARMGVEYYLKFLALVSISLGVLNLLPIPILDGGHLLYYAIEIVKRGPVSERTLEIGQQIGLALLLMLMAFAFFNDINRLISG